MVIVPSFGLGQESEILASAACILGSMAVGASNTGVRTSPWLARWRQLTTVTAVVGYKYSKLVLYIQYMDQVRPKSFSICS